VGSRKHISLEDLRACRSNTVDNTLRTESQVWEVQLRRAGFMQHDARDRALPKGLCLLLFRRTVVAICSGALLLPMPGCLVRHL
jgi:hypothetical protein